MAMKDRHALLVRLPAWLPDAARNYLVHTEAGLSIRAVARANNCHASTIMRQVRRYENRRDDPLIDDGLRDLSQHVPKAAPHVDGTVIDIRQLPPPDGETPAEARIARDAVRILRRLCETGAVLAVGREMEMAVVVRDAPDGTTTRTAVIARDMAQIMALRDWIACATPAARVARYHITSAGRVELKLMMAAAENRAQGFAEAPADFAEQHRDWGDREVDDDGETRNLRTNLAESPLTGLARRRDRDGEFFLSRDLVAAGERLREDFELAQMAPQVTQNWDRFLTGPGTRTTGQGGGGATAAKDRVGAALSDLGPGLGDVVLRCCCYLEGLEQAEKRMGWAARSGKIVLRIALQRLKRHYDEAHGKFAPMIG
jgi:hypothetical protein